VFSAVGDDAFGEQILRELAALGIDTTGVRVEPGITSIAIYALLFGGTKRPMTYRLSDITPWPPVLDVGADNQRPDCLLFAGLLHFKSMYHSGMAESFAAARRASVLTALDPQFPLEPTPEPWLPHISDVLAHTDVFLCDEGEAESIFRAGSPAKAAAAAIDYGCRTAVVKMGPAGAIVADSTGLVEQPAVSLGHRVDETVGAGDSFDAGFLAALLRGAAPADAARHATATAACSLLRAGRAQAINAADIASMVQQVPAGHAVRA
jgi:2-dehydro-3-deoxygluconokinase